MDLALHFQHVLTIHRLEANMKTNQETILAEVKDEQSRKDGNSQAIIAKFSNQEGEWYMLFGVLFAGHACPEVAAQFNSILIAKRIDELRRAMAS